MARGGGDLATDLATGLGVGLPASGASPLVGRDDDAALAVGLLDDGCRLLTITGPGGVGKSRLAVELARRLASGFADGVTFVPAAALTEPAALPPAVARALGVAGAADDGDGPHSGHDALCAALRHRRALLVVDNVEQIVGGAPFLGRLVERCPHVTVMVTSRRPLRLSAERVVTLRPLATAATTGGDDPPDRSPAVRMFCERVTAISPDATFSDDELATVAEICRHLDGLPLAIELAAASTRTVPVAELLRQLTAAGPSSVLTRGPRDADQRHRTLDATIGWSWDLLPDPAQRLLRLVAVFPGTWSLDALIGVAGDELDGRSVIDVLADLVDLHLVEPVTSRDGTARYTLLETIRGFARRQLAEAGEVDMAERQHAKHWTRVAEAATAGLRSAEERRWLDAIGDDLDDLLAALRWHRRHGRDEDALRIVLALSAYWVERGPPEIDLDVDHDSSASADPTLRAIAAAWSVRLAVERGAEVAGPAGDPRLQRLEAARTALDRADARREWLQATGHLLYVLRMRGEHERAAAVLADALGRPDTARHPWEHAELLHLGVLLAQDRDDDDAAAASAGDALRVARAAGHERMRLRAMITLTLRHGAVADTLGEVTDAVTNWEQRGDHRSAANTAVVVALAMQGRADWAGATEWFLRALESARRCGYFHGIGFAVTGVLTLAGNVGGHAADAMRLHGALSADLPRLTEVMPATFARRYGRAVDRIAERLGAETAGALAAAGAAMDIEQVIGEAAALGRRFLDEQTAGTTERPKRRRGPRANPELTDREREIVAALAAGLTNKEIGSRLGLSPKTVMHHTTSVYRKLGVRGRAEAVAHAVRVGMIELPAR